MIILNLKSTILATAKVVEVNSSKVNEYTVELQRFEQAGTMKRSSRQG